MSRFQELIHGGDILTYREKDPLGEFLDFSANINPLGMPKSAVAALESCAPHCLHYPDHQCRVLKAALAEFEGVPISHILCGNGAAELIFRIAFALKPKRALLLAPTFAEYELALQQVGCQIHLHRLTSANNFAVEKNILPLPLVDMVFLCNPNNPTGMLMDQVLLRNILRSCLESGATLVVDECFLDFVEDGEDRSLKRLLSSFPNLIILRAFTKLFAMPGLRLGYALCSDMDILARMSKAGPPWSVSVPAQLCGIAAAGERSYVARTVDFVTRQRAFLAQGLADLGVQVFPSVANYILFYSDTVHLAEQLLDNGIIIRDCSNYHQLTPGYYRVAVRSHWENTALLGAIKETQQCKV